MCRGEHEISRFGKRRTQENKPVDMCDSISCGDSAIVDFLFLQLLQSTLEGPHFADNCIMFVSDAF